MNSFIKQTCDKITGEARTETIDIRDKHCKIRLCHNSSSKGDFIFFELEFTREGDRPLLEQGQLFVLINGNKRYSLEPHIGMPAACDEVHDFDYRGNPYSCLKWREYIYYIITEEQLREMANATNIEMKVLGGTVSEVIDDKNGVYKDSNISFLIMARAIYNAIFDNSIFNDELENEKNRLEEERLNTLAKSSSYEEEEEDEDEDDDDDDDEDDDDEEDKDEESANKIKTGENEKKQNPTADAIKSIKKEWAVLKKRCQERNDIIGAFIDEEECTWNTSVDGIIRKFGDDKSELYKHLNFCIPLYESLYTHMHEFNKAHPNTQINIDYCDEKKVKKFLEKLKAVQEKIYPTILRKRILIASLIIGGIILLFILFS